MASALVSTGTTDVHVSDGIVAARTTLGSDVNARSSARRTVTTPPRTAKATSSGTESARTTIPRSTGSPRRPTLPNSGSTHLRVATCPFS